MASRRATTVPSSFKSIPTDSKRQFLYSLFLLHCCCNILRCVICFKLWLILMCRKHTEAQRFFFDALYILFFSDRPRRIQKQFISRNTFTRIFLCKESSANIIASGLAYFLFVPISSSFLYPLFLLSSKSSNPANKANNVGSVKKTVKCKYAILLWA